MLPPNANRRPLDNPMRKPDPTAGPAEQGKRCVAHIEAGDKDGRVNGLQEAAAAPFRLAPADACAATSQQDSRAGAQQR